MNAESRERFVNIRREPFWGFVILGEASMVIVGKIAEAQADLAIFFVDRLPRLWQLRFGRFLAERQMRDTVWTSNAYHAQAEKYVELYTQEIERIKNV